MKRYFVDFFDKSTKNLENTEQDLGRINRGVGPVKIKYEQIS